MNHEGSAPLPVCRMDSNYPWREFHQRLITEIHTWEQQGHPAQDWHYYQRWLAALEYLLRDRGLINQDELDQRIKAIATLDEHHR